MSYNTVKYNILSKEIIDEGCPICTDSFKPTTEIIKTDCNHYFCGKCIFTWMRTNPTCPSCRTNTRDVVTPIELDGENVLICLHSLICALSGRSL